MKKSMTTAGKTARMFSMLILALGLMMTGCKKDNPQVINGKDGKDGKDGVNGTNGVDGNANVKSLIITTTSSDWSGNGAAYGAVKPCSIITPDIQNKGMVMVYILDGTDYLALPFSIRNTNYTSHYFFSTAVGSISFYVQDDDGLTQNPSNQTFKVVAISASQLVKNPNVDLKNYQEVKSVFNLQD